MVLAHDAACYIDWIDPNVLAMMTDWSYLHIHNACCLPPRAGVTEAQITTMLMDTPRRYFEDNDAYWKSRARHPRWKAACSRGWSSHSRSAAVRHRHRPRCNQGSNLGSGADGLVRCRPSPRRSGPWPIAATSDPASSNPASGPPS